MITIFSLKNKQLLVKTILCVTTGSLFSSAIANETVYAEKVVMESVEKSTSNTDINADSVDKSLQLKKEESKEKQIEKTENDNQEKSVSNNKQDIQETEQPIILNLSKEERNKMREKAVIAARSGDYNTALPMLNQLYRSDASDKDAIYDYLTVLNWAGKYTEVINVYNKSDIKSNIAEMPSYVRQNVVGAYYRLHRLDEAIEILQPMIKEGDKEALLLLGQIYIKAGKYQEADDVYNGLLKKDPDDISIYKHRALAAISANNWHMAVKEWRNLKNICEQNPEKYANSGIYKEMADSLSVAYIKLGSYKEAEAVLKPYIDDGTANASMAGNYISALILLNRQKEVESIYYKFFKDYQSTPAFVLRELAGSYVRLKNYDKAIEVYEYLINSPAVSTGDKLNFAYVACLNKGYADLGVATYADVLASTDGDKMASRILSEARLLLLSGRYGTAEKVYYELIKHDKRFHNIYAGHLLNAGQYQTAWHEYELMLDDPQLHDLGAEGIVQTAIRLGDYKTAEKFTAELKESHDGNEGDYPKAAGSLKNRRMGEIYFNGNVYTDHDDSDQTDISTYFDQYMGEGMWVEGGLGKIYIKDSENGEHAHLSTARYGVRNTTRKWDVFAAANLFRINSDNSVKPYIDILFRPTDRHSIGFSYSNEPVYDADAINYDGGSIFSKNYSLRYNYNVLPGRDYYVELSRYLFDDGNRRWGWVFGENLSIYDDRRRGKTLVRNLHWGRSRNRLQDVVYSSPRFNENFGGEWRWGKALGNDDVLYRILGLVWDRDYPDPITLNPYMRVEYDKTIDRYHYFSAGFTYSWRTGSWWGGRGIYYNSKQIDFTYNVVW